MSEKKIQRAESYKYANHMIQKMLTNSLTIDEKNMLESLIYVLPEEVSVMQRDILKRVSGTVKQHGESFDTIAEKHNLTKEEAGIEFLTGAEFLADKIAANAYASYIIGNMRVLIHMLSI